MTVFVCVCAGISYVSSYKRDEVCYIWVDSVVRNSLPFERQQKAVSQVPAGITNYGNGWRKAAVNQCLEFVLTLV